MTKLVSSDIVANKMVQQKETGQGFTPLGELPDGFGHLPSGIQDSLLETFNKLRQLRNEFDAGWPIRTPEQINEQIIPVFNEKSQNLFDSMRTMKDEKYSWRRTLRMLDGAITQEIYRSDRSRGVIC